MPSALQADVEVDEVLQAWLHESRIPLSDAVLDAALARTRAMPARHSRRGLLRRGWSLVAAAIAVVVLLGSLGVAASWAPPTRPQSARPTEAPPPAALVPTDVASSPLAGVWYRTGPSDRGPGVGVLRLSAFSSVQGWGGVYLGLANPTVRGDLLDIPALPGGACAGQAARYRWTVDGDVAAFHTPDDPCPARQEVMTATWQRLLPGMSLADRFEFPFVYRTADARPLVEAGTKAHVLADGGHVDAVRGFGIWVVEDAFRDPCAASGSVTPAPGATGLIEHLRSVEALEVDDPRPVTFDGLPAMAIGLERLPRGCANQHLRLWRDSGATLGDGNIWFSLPAGGRADVLLLEMSGSTVALVAWAPDGEEPTTAAIRELLASIDFIEVVGD